MLRYVMIAVVAGSLGVGAAYLNNAGYVSAAVDTVSGLQTTSVSDDAAPQPAAEPVAEAEPMTFEDKVAKAANDAEEASKIAKSCRDKPVLTQLTCVLNARKKLESSFEVSKSVQDMMAGAGAHAEGE